jgi:hypothetical protein
MTLRKREETHLKEEALDRTMWRSPFGRGFGPVAKHTTKLMNLNFRKYLKAAKKFKLYL